MRYILNKYPNRQSHRLRGYDYSSGGIYFLTLCTYERRSIFGYIENQAMYLNPYGEIVEHEWQNTAELRPHIELDKFVVMPNHFHALIRLLPTQNDLHQGIDSPSYHLISRSIGAIISGFKSAVTKQINTLSNHSTPRIWHRNYHDHIVRSEASLNKIHQYVLSNPALWKKDTFFVD